MLDRASIRVVAAQANVDERTLRRALDGLMPRSLAVRDAIARALDANGHKEEAALLRKDG